MKRLTKDNITTSLQTMLVIFLLSYSAVNGNSEATQQTASSELSLQQATVQEQHTTYVVTPVKQSVSIVKKQVQKIMYLQRCFEHTNCFPFNQNLYTK